MQKCAYGDVSWMGNKNKCKFDCKKCTHFQASGLKNPTHVTITKMPVTKKNDL